MYRERPGSTRPSLLLLIAWNAAAAHVLGARGPAPLQRAARVITDVLTDTSDATGVYYNENGKPMRASKQVSDPEYANRYVAETRALLATAPSRAS
jgi:hypothetical protein